MKRVLAVAVVAALAATTPALAAPKKAPKPKPVKMSYFLHGAQPLGDLEQNFASSTPLPMDAKKPTGTAAKRKYVTNYIVGPNTECAGNPLLAFWEGNLAGTLTGAYTITLHTTASPQSQLRVRLFDTPSPNACDSDLGQEYPGAILDKIVTVPQGDGKVTISGVFTKPKEIKGVLQIEMSAAGLADPSQVTINYDATSAPSSIAFSCLPRKGKKACA